MTKKESGYKVIVSESVVDYIGQRTDYANIGKKYGFTARWNLKDVPFLVQDGLSEEQAESLKLELRNIGMTAQIMESEEKVQIKKKNGFLSVFKKKRVKIELSA